MLLQEELNKLEELYDYNRKMGLAPRNTTELAKYLGVARQTIWLAMYTTRTKKTENRIRELLAKPKGKTFCVKIYEDKIDKLVEYGFVLSHNGTYQTKLIDSNSNIKVCYIVDEKKRLCIYVTNAYDKIKTINTAISQIDLIAILLNDKVAYLTEDNN